jgi:hypothetical protein
MDANIWSRYHPSIKMIIRKKNWSCVQNICLTPRQTDRRQWYNFDLIWRLYFTSPWWQSRLNHWLFRRNSKFGGNTCSNATLAIRNSKYTSAELNLDLFDEKALFVAYSILYPYTFLVHILNPLCPLSLWSSLWVSEELIMISHALC